MGNSCLQATVRNTSKGILTVAAVETPNVVVTICGQTEDSDAITEEVVMDAVEKQTAHNYINYETIRKDRFNNYNIVLSDVDGMQMSCIPNNELEAEYLIVDVSTFPFYNGDVSQQSNYVEVLYKKALPWLSDDGQSFPAKDYDDILVDKILQIFYEESKNDKMAILYDQKVTRALGRKLLDKNKSTEDIVSFVADGHDQLLATLRGRRRRIWGYGYGWGSGLVN